ncbi:EamA family transporter [Cryomorphaceae bacterium]|nr:EamA family transporter [Cryomorphaceae bacterium]
MPNRYRAHIALFVVNLIYGINYTVAKDVMPTYIEPLGFILIRVTGAVALFWLVSALFPRERIARKDYPRLILCGVFGVAANQMLFFEGLNLTTPINAAIIMTSNPVLVLIMSALLIRERITWVKILGILLGATGAIMLIAGDGAIDLLDNDKHFGNFLVFLNATSYALYLVVVKPLMNTYSPITVIKWVFTFGLLMVAPFGWNQLSGVEWGTMPPEIYGAVAFVVLGTTFLAYLLNTYALKTVNPSVVSIYIYLQPALAAIFALAVGSDRLTPIMLASAAMIFTGVYLVSRRPNRASRREAQIE